jgi:hypothetical protein
VLDSSTASVEMAIPPSRPRQQQQVQAAPPVAAPSRPSYASRPAAKVWGEPKVHRYGSRAVVSFRIWNQGNETISSNVDVELYLNGEIVDSAGELVEVAPGDKRRFEVTFERSGAGRAGNGERAGAVKEELGAAAFGCPLAAPSEDLMLGAAPLAILAPGIRCHAT